MEQFDANYYRYYRFVYVGVTGRQEYVIEQNIPYRVVYMEKQEDAYLLNKTTDLNSDTDLNLKSAISTAKSYYT